MTDVLPGEPDPIALGSDPPLPPHPADSERRRGRERRILRGGVASAATQVLTAVCTLATIPLVVRRLPAEPFGVWITLSSLVILLGFLDLGVGSALIGGVARTEAEGDREGTQEMISTAFIGLAGIAGLFALLFLAMYPFVPWDSLLGVTSPAHRGEVGGSVAVLVAGVLLSLPLSVAGRAQTGLQEADVVVLWRGIGTVVQLLATVGLFLAEATLVWFVAALVAGPVLGSALNSIALFTGKRKWLHVDRSKASLGGFRRLGSMGFLFFILLVAGTLAYQSDALVIAHYLGSAKAGEYGVPLRLFMFVPSIVNLAMVPLWAAYADAWQGGDLEWIRRIFRRSVLLALATNGAAGLALLVLARPILRLWVGDAVEPSTFFLVALVVYVLVWGVSGAVAMLFNGCHVVKFQIVASLVMVVANLALSIALLPSLDVAGPVVGTIVAQSACVLLPAFLYMRRLLRPAAPGVTGPRVEPGLSRA